MKRNMQLENKKNTDEKDNGSALEVGSGRPSVFDFTSYRDFLKSWIEWKKSVTSRYTASVFGRNAEVKSRNLFGLVVRGERNLGETTRIGFARALGLSDRESSYFHSMVIYEQSDSPKLKEES